MRETFELVRGEMSRAGSGMLPAGIVLTGGAAQLAGTAELAREVLGDAGPGRRAGRTSAGSSTRSSTRRYSTAVGLLQWGAGSIAAGEPLRYESAPAMGGLGRHPGRAALDLSLGAGRSRQRARTSRRRSASARDQSARRRRGAGVLASRRRASRPSSRSGPGLTRALRPDRACASFVAGRGRRAAERLRAPRDGRARDHGARRGLRRRPARGARRPAAARRPLAAPPRVAGPRRRPRPAAARAAVADGAGRRRAARSSGRGSRSRSSTRTATTRRGRSG